jgi:hypothetical protein
VLGAATIPWFDDLLRQAGRPELTQLGVSTIPAVLAALLAVMVGAVLAGRRPRHAVGWLLLALGMSVTASGVADGYARYGLVAAVEQTMQPTQVSLWLRPYDVVRSL